ncbi:MAG: hypothetical protein M9927_09000 [Anaerolineae bacterium]|nr:hypothetical protein [Anaerolineae bacterium]
MFINVTEAVEGKQVTRQQTVGGLLLNCDQMYPHELREGSKTASSEIFELLREVSLNRRTKVTLAGGKQVMRSEGLLGLWVRYHDSPLAVSTTIVNLVAQFKWLKNKHTKKVIRLALHTVNDRPAEPPTAAAQMLDVDIPITIKPLPVPVDLRASTLAVDENNRVIAHIANGLVVDPMAKGRFKSDRLCKSRGEVLKRFIDVMDKQAPATRREIERIRRAIDAGHQIRLLTSLAWEEHGLIIADAVMRAKVAPPAPRATREAAAHVTKDRRLGIVYTARTGIDMEEDLPYDAMSEEPDVAWEHRLDARRVRRLLVAAGTYIYRPQQSRVRVVTTTRQVRHDDGRVELQTIKVLGISTKDYSRQWVTYYYQPADVMANRSNPLKSARYSRILGRPKLEMTHGHTEPAWDIRNMPDARWVRHQFYPIAQMLMRTAYQDWVADRYWAAPYEDIEAQEEFHHRTMRQDGQLHEDDNDGRFDQHDDAILGQSDQERTEHELALEESDRSAYDLTLTGELDARTAAWLANIPAEPIVNPFRRRTVTYGVEEDLVLPGHVIASDTMVRDCIVRKVVDGIVYEGYVMPAPEQVAAAVSGGIITRILVFRNGKALSREEQMAANGGDWWKYRSYSGPHKLLEQHLLANLAPLPAPQPAPMFDFPPIEMERPLLGVQCDQVATDKGIAWKMAGVGKVKWQVVYTFTPGDPAWHEPLADDDNRHLIVPQDDDSSLLALTRLVERILA